MALVKELLKRCSEVEVLYRKLSHLQRQQIMRLCDGTGVAEEVDDFVCETPRMAILIEELASKIQELEMWHIQATNKIRALEDLLIERQIKMTTAELRDRILESCPHAYIDDNGQVIDPCHFWFSDVQNIEKWGEE